MTDTPFHKLNERRAKLLLKGYEDVYTKFTPDYAWCVLIREPLTLHYLQEWANGEFKERDISLASRFVKRCVRKREQIRGENSVMFVCDCVTPAVFGINDEETIG